jgi:cyclic-di-GMP-binding protein
MTEPKEPERPSAESKNRQEGEPRALAFADVESAKRWAHALPHANVALSCETVQTQLRALAAAQFAPRERATIAEVLREQVSHLHTELARRYAGKGQPAVDREAEAAEQAIALWQGLWEQYSTCLKPLLEGDPELTGVKPKILQRGMYVGKQLVLAHGLARRAVPGSVWHELHAYYRLAEMLECAVAAVSDNLLPNAVGISCYSTYSHALLLGLADPCAMSVRQIELTDRWLGMWSRKVFPYAQQRETEGAVIEIDLDSGTGAMLVGSVSPDPAASMRFGYPGKLATSVRGRLKRLQSGANPAELQLGHDCSIDQCTTLLGHLDARWYQVPRRRSGLPGKDVELCAGGLPAAYFRVGGHTFERKGPAGRLSFAEAQQLHAIGPVPDYDRGREGAELEWAWERWEGSIERRDASVARVSDPVHRWMLDQLAIVRADGQIRVGSVTRVALGADGQLGAEGQLGLTLKLWSGTPVAMALHPLSAASSDDPPLPALRFDETPDDKPCLVLPPRTFNPSRVLRSQGVGPERKYRLTRLLHRGTDFERAAFEETT